MLHIVLRPIRCGLSLTVILPAVIGTVLLPDPRIGNAEEWRQFRGPGARGISDHQRLPDRWSATENIVWKQPIPGRGWSSPIVTGERVFVTTVTRRDSRPESAKPGLYFGGNRNTPDDVIHEWRLLCLSLKDGKLLWQRVLHDGKPQTPRHIKNSYASETPVTDGRNVYVLFGDVGLFCVSVGGEPVWSQELPPCRTRYDWGTAASPVLHDGRLYMVSDNEDRSFLAAFDAATGEQLWRVARDEKSNWATPFVWVNDLRTEIITPGTGKVRSYDLEGKLLYEFGGCSSITIATPFAAHGLLYVSSGYVLDKRKPIFAIRPGASGDISLAESETSSRDIAWCQPQGAPYNPTTIVYGDQLYVLHDRGFVTSFDARTGEPVYDRQRLPNGRAFTASPWASDGKLFCLNEFGETYVIQTGREFKLLHRNSLSSDELCMSTPALAGRFLLLRTGDQLYCIARGDSASD